MASVLCMALAEAFGLFQRQLVIGNGAIDLVVVRHPCGRLKASACHVCFSRKHSKALRNCQITMEVNGKKLPFRMEVDQKGYGHFLEKALREITEEPSPKKAFPESHWEIDKSFLSKITENQLMPQDSQKSQQKTRFLGLFDSLKTLHLPHECLKLLDLKPGENQVTYKLIEKGTLKCQAELRASIFLWDCTTKFVVSDIDGTITKSELLGILLPMLGKDWSHHGIAELYERFEEKGHKLVYLTARPISQSEKTKKYIRWVDQSVHKLPNGPILCAPDQVYSCLKRELIRESYLFKTECLWDLKNAFGKHNCFFAGFGNQDSDSIAYSQSGFEQIYLINRKGRIKKVEDNPRNLGQFIASCPSFKEILMNFAEYFDI